MELILLFNNMKYFPISLYNNIRANREFNHTRVAILDLTDI